MPDMRELAEKARESNWIAIRPDINHLAQEEIKFIAACSPERILAMLDVIEAAQHYEARVRAAESITKYGTEFGDRLRDALARLDALNEEKR